MFIRLSADHRPSETDLAVVEHGVLPGRDAAIGFVQLDAPGVVVDRREGTVDRLRSVAQFGLQPVDPRVLDKCEPVYEEIEGWCAPTTEARRVEDLPPKAVAYVERVAELSRTPVAYISVGPDRDETITV